MRERAPVQLPHAGGEDDRGDGALGGRGGKARSIRLGSCSGTAAVSQKSEATSLYGFASPLPAGRSRPWRRGWSVRRGPRPGRGRVWRRTARSAGGSRRGRRSPRTRPPCRRTWRSRRPGRRPSSRAAPARAWAVVRASPGCQQPVDAVTHVREDVADVPFTPSLEDVVGHLRVCRGNFRPCFCGCLRARRGRYDDAWVTGVGPVALHYPPAGVAAPGRGVPPAALQTALGPHRTLAGGLSGMDGHGRFGAVLLVRPALSPRCVGSPSEAADLGLGGACPAAGAVAEFGMLPPSIRHSPGAPPVPLAPGDNASVRPIRSSTPRRSVVGSEMICPSWSQADPHRAAQGAEWGSPTRRAQTGRHGFDRRNGWTTASKQGGDDIGRPRVRRLWCPGRTDTSSPYWGFLDSPPTGPPWWRTSSIAASSWGGPTACSDRSARSASKAWWASGSLSRQARWARG